ncbi:hypothetical protein COB57_02410 [Candidatus Peregrinibacteria bacterium]|nr:MAG: hypothetical protein COB57_02410 [Candidatus Peregrinibacteria bacterium]
MKHFFSFLLAFCFLTPLAFADINNTSQDVRNFVESIENTKRQIDHIQDAKRTNVLLPSKYGGKYTSNLPQGDIGTHFLPRIIDIIMTLSYTAIFAMIMYSGVLYIIEAYGETSGSEKTNEQAKELLEYSIIGAIIITISYGLVSAVINLQFFA